jgi:hypothetical protein
MHLTFPPYPHLNDQKIVFTSRGGKKNPLNLLVEKKILLVQLCDYQSHPINNRKDG